MRPTHEIDRARTQLSVPPPLVALVPYVRSGQEREALAHMASLARTDARYIVHEAGELQPDGSQTCHRCGARLLEAAPDGANHDLWGFAFGRRVIAGPTCTFLVTADRALGSDEVPCR